MNALFAIQASSLSFTPSQSIPLGDASALTDIIQIRMETASPAKTLFANNAPLLELIVINASRMPPKMPTEFANATQDTSPTTENA